MAPSFALHKSLKRSRRSGVPSPGILVPVISSPERIPYGTSHVRRAPQVDLHAPGGRYRQTTKKTPFTPRRSRSPGPLVSLPRTPARHATRDPRQAQWKTWTSVLIPRLIPVWLELLRRSEGLRNIGRELEGCDCVATVRKLTVTVVSWQGVSTVLVCSCRAPQSLLSMGYLVSAPTRPTYAFDVQMLDYMRLLHQRTAPNKTAWSTTLETFLRARGYKIQGKDVIRRKLATSLKWFSYLLAETERKLRRTLINPDLRAVEGEDDEDSFWADVESEDEYEGLEYLAWRCPACFGDATAIGKLLFDFVVCLDACFTQKRRNPVRGEGTDPPLSFRPSVFLTVEEIADAEKLVNEARPAREGTQRTTTLQADTVEEGMKVPKSVLDACLESFTAADEKRTKASTKFFADTGLMAMLCRHDQVLWLANMTTAGERQYYALALIIKLFKHLPGHSKVGILYDIGCQLERSIVKWGFIPEFRDRISWAVSVFHAYGHQWACQLVYHPRKRDGFGLSDGEGCERLWSALEFLIPTLRVSGYHQRIFTLDGQVMFETEEGRRTLGDWLLRKSTSAKSKRGEAVAALSELEHGEETLEAEWGHQVVAQTRPLTRATGGLANKNIKAILSLMEAVSGLKKELADISRRLGRNPSAEKLEELLETRLHLREQMGIIETQLDSKRNALGVTERQDLRKLVKDKYLETRLKALAIKERLRAKIQGRKFELERVDRAYQNATANDSRLQGHIKSQVARHQPNIMNLVKKFNDLCGDLQELIREGKATPNARVPIRIEPNQLYSLDVDAPIWDDRGLNDGDTGPIPPWLGDDGVRNGIRAWLTIKRCDEEVKRLKMECNNLRLWARKEYLRMEHSLNVVDDLDICYQLKRMKEELAVLITSWKICVSSVAPSVSSGDWGVGGAREPEGGNVPDDGSSEEDRDGVNDNSDSELSDASDADLEAEDRVLQAMEHMNFLGGDEGSGDEGGDENTLSAGVGSGNEDGQGSDGNPSAGRKRRRIHR